MERPMNPSETFKARSLREWRTWLKSHHASERVVWLMFPKAKLVPTVTYGEALDEALCWGWIDSLIKRLDDAWYARKFTPRTNPAKWSAVNIGRMRSLLESGRVRPSGLAVIAPKVL